MKYLSRRLRPRRSRSSIDKSRGAAAIVVGISLLALIGSAGLAVDLGNHRATKSALTTATDAGALAAAHSLNEGDSLQTACALAQTEMATNEAGATMVSCVQSTSTNNIPIVTVEVTESVDYIFAEALGLDSATLTTTSSARHGIKKVIGARPFAMCIEAIQPLIGGWDSLGTTPIAAIRVPYGKGAQPNACNGGDNVPGNWGSLDFNGGANSTGDQADWIRNGFTGEIDPSISPEGDTGAVGNALGSALSDLIASGDVFPVPLFGSISGGSGGNATFDLVGFMSAQLTDFNVAGAAADRWLEFTFYPDNDLPGVPCCNPNSLAINIHNTGICATNNETDAC